MVNDKETKTVTIIVEGAPHEWPKNADVGYADVVTLEVPTYPQHPEITLRQRVQARLGLHNLT